MNELYTFYKDVLGKLPFSITSFFDAEKKVEDFFDSLCESPIFIGRTHIDFISYALAKLEDPIDFEVSNLTNKSIFFNSLNERSIEMFLMHDYYNFKHFLAEPSKQIASEYTEANSESREHEKKKESESTKEANEKISKKEGGRKFFTAEIIAKLFVNGTGFRVKCSDRNHTSVKYEQHIDVITIQIPFHFIFNRKSEEEYKDIQDKLFDLYESKLNDSSSELHNILDAQFLSIKKEGNKFIFKEQENVSTELLSKSLLNKESIEKLKKVLYQKLFLLNITNINDFFGDMGESGALLDDDTTFSCDEEKKKTKGDYLAEFVNLIISQGFSSFLFNTWIENIPSIVNVDAVTGAKQSLGALVVGYREQGLSYDERTYLKLVADRVSHIFAAEALFEISDELKYRRLRKIQVDLLKTFHRDVLNHNSIDHGKNKISDDSLARRLKFFKDHSEEKLANCGLGGFKPYVESVFLLNETIDYGFFTEFHPPDNSEPNPLNTKHLLYKHAPELNDLTIKIKVGSAEVAKPKVNVVFPHDLIIALTANQNKVSGNRYVKTVETRTVESKLIVQLTFETEICLGCFYKSLTGIGRDEGDLGQFLRDNYDAIRTIGNLEICEIVDSKLIPLLDFEKHLKPVYKLSKIEKLVARDVEIFNKLENKKLDSLVYSLHYRSI